MKKKGGYTILLRFIEEILRSFPFFYLHRGSHAFQITRFEGVFRDSELFSMIAFSLEEKLCHSSSVSKLLYCFDKKTGGSCKFLMSRVFSVRHFFSVKV